MLAPLRAAIAFVRAVLATTLLAGGLFGLAQGVVATPAPLTDGSEVVVADREGNRLLGYGRVEGGVLRLSLVAHDDGGLVVMVVDPEGRLSTLVGRFAADGLRVRDPGVDGDVTLLSWLSERGVSLTLDTARRTGDDDDGDDGDVGDRDDAPSGGPSDDGDDANDGDGMDDGDRDGMDDDRDDDGRDGMDDGRDDGDRDGMDGDRDDHGA